MTVFRREVCFLFHCEFFISNSAISKLSSSSQKTKISRCFAKYDVRIDQGKAILSGFGVAFCIREMI